MIRSKTTHGKEAVRKKINITPLRDSHVVPTASGLLRMTFSDVLIGWGYLIPMERSRRGNLQITSLKE